MTVMLATTSEVFTCHVGIADGQKFRTMKMKWLPMAWYSDQVSWQSFS